MRAVWQRLVDDHGYEGSYSSVYRYIRRCEEREPQGCVLLEVAPGAPAQVDFGYAGCMLDPRSGRKRKAWIFVMTLSHSRHQFARFVFDQRIATWLRCHRETFVAFGGVPAKVVIDNVKVAIMKALWRDQVVQRSYRDLAEHYGFLISPCRPRTPEHKGEVESGVHYVKRNFVEGRELRDIREGNEQLDVWVLETPAICRARAAEIGARNATVVEALLSERPMERRAQKQLQMQLRHGSFCADKSLEKLDWSFNPSINRQQVLDLATCRWINRKEVVLVVGPSAVSKRHIAQALGHEACLRGHNVLFTSVSKMLAHIHGGRADGTHGRRLAGYLRPELLILDDFGLKALRGIEQEDFYEVINERYERCSLMLTSNRDYKEWPEVFAYNPLLASAALDRMAHRAHLITIAGASYRAQQKPKQTKSKE